MIEFLLMSSVFLQPVKSPAIYESIIATVTGYSSTRSQTDSSPLIMASNKKVYTGAIACPRRYSFGTKVEINGKEYVCEDRMALKNDGRFDIFMGNGKEGKKRAMRWGKKSLPVFIMSN